MRNIMLLLILLSITYSSFSQNSKAINHYHSGVNYMDNYNYEMAENEFLQALQSFTHWIYLSDRQLFTYDSNGAPRERYFTYYNIACVYSITNKLELSMEYLKEALEHGYPYINHIFNDEDLLNLFNSSVDIRNQIQRIYNDGFINNYSDKSYIEWSASDYHAWSFMKNGVIQRKGSYITKHNYRVAQYGNYEIRNYNIIATYNIERGNEAYGYIESRGGIPIYEGYTPYERVINEREIISIKDISERRWSEIPLDEFLRY